MKIIITQNCQTDKNIEIFFFSRYRDTRGPSSFDSCQVNIENAKQRNEKTLHNRRQNGRLSTSTDIVNLCRIIRRVRAK